MPGPQLEDGYTQLANELIEQLARADLTGPQLRIVLAVIRKTYGECQRDESGSIKRDDSGRPTKRIMASISLTEFIFMTGLSRTTVHDNLEILVKRGVLLKVGSTGGRGKPPVYGIQKDATRWKIPRGISNFHKGAVTAIPLKGAVTTESFAKRCRDDGIERCRGDGTVEIKEIKISLKDHPEEKLSAVTTASFEQGGEGMEPPLIEELLSRYNQAQLETITAYWTAIRRTRTTGKLADSVVRKWMDKWSAFPPETIIKAMRVHMERYQGRREEYTHGIVRGLEREAKQRGTSSASNQSTTKARASQYFNRDQFLWRPGGDA